MNYKVKSIEVGYMLATYEGARVEAATGQERESSKESMYHSRVQTAQSM